MPNIQNSVRCHSVPVLAGGARHIVTLASKLVVAAVAVMGLAANLGVAAGAEFNVTVDTADDRIDDNTNDGVCHTTVNTCSLRAAIMQANHTAVAVAHINVPAGTYQLTRAPTRS